MFFRVFMYFFPNLNTIDEVSILVSLNVHKNGTSALFFDIKHSSRIFNCKKM